MNWQVIADDGDAVTGGFSFGVGPVPAGALFSGAAGTSSAGQAATALLRWPMFAVIAVIAGASSLSIGLPLPTLAELGSLPATLTLIEASELALCASATARLRRWTWIPLATHD